MTTTPEPAVSPAPDTEALRPLIDAAVKQGIKDWDRDYDSRASGPITNYVLGALDYALRTREAGLRAEVERLETLVLEKHQTAEDWRNAAITERDRQLARSAGARTIPDGAAVDRVALRMFRVHVYGTLTSERYDASARNQWAKVLDEDDRETWRKLARALLADLGATPTVDGSGPGVTG